eukprot:TRINITY_DN4867_c0_g1_i1.p1 TRINITY_DN4867_c0_g1~~TRINITY_DN4867_c0_g1_i1.p1  ORF type:complete len:222 (-),score=12.92 TRINITY_DN4867_c0_g1_i1:172-837(-)
MVDTVPPLSSPRAAPSSQLPRRSMPPYTEEQGDVVDTPASISEGDLQCPLCLCLLQAAVVTSCGHTFCSECLVEQLEHAGRSTCAVCRSTVVAAQPSFSIRRLCDQMGRLNPASAKPDMSAERIRELDSRLPVAVTETEEGTWTALLTNVRLLLWPRQGQTWKSAWTWFVVVMVFFYILSPIDLIADHAVPGFGLIDDLFIFLWLVYFLWWLASRANSHSD